MKKLIIALLLLVSASADAQYYPWGWKQWMEPVANVAALPASGNSPGDTRVSEDTFNIYVWNGTMWVDQSGSGSVVPGGVNGSVQFKNGMSFAGDSDLIYSGTGSGSLLLSGTSASLLQLDDQNGTGSSDLQFQSANAAVWDLSSGSGGYPFQLVDDGNSATPAMSFDTSDNVNFSASIMSGLGTGGGIIQANGSPGEFRINDSSGGGESIFEFSTGPVGSETDLYDWITGAFGPLALYDATSTNLMESWDSSDNLSINSNSVTPQNYTFNGSNGPNIILNDTSGSGVDSIYFNNSGSNLYALYSGNGQAFSLQDLVSGYLMLQWNTNDDLIIQNSNTSGNPPLEVKQNGSNPDTAQFLDIHGNNIGFYSDGSGGMGIEQNGAQVIDMQGGGITFQGGGTFQNNMGVNATQSQFIYGSGGSTPSLYINPDFGGAGANGLFLGQTPGTPMAESYTGCYMYADNAANLQLDCTNTGAYSPILQSHGAQTLDLAAMGTIAAPTLSFSGDNASTGLYVLGTGGLGISMRGTEAMGIAGAGGISFPIAGQTFTVASPATFQNGTTLQNGVVYTIQAATVNPACDGQIGCFGITSTGLGCISVTGTPGSYVNVGSGLACTF